MGPKTTAALFGLDQWHPGGKVGTDRLQMEMWSASLAEAIGGQELLGERYSPRNESWAFLIVNGVLFVIPTMMDEKR